MRGDWGRCVIIVNIAKPYCAAMLSSEVLCSHFGVLSCDVNNAHDICDQNVVMQSCIASVT